MDTKCQNLDSDPNCLLSQLNTARKEINNLRQQIKNLRYIYEKDVESIKSLLGLCTDGTFNSANLVPPKTQPSTSSDSEDIITLKPIGIISTWFPSKRGTPRQPGICGKAPGKLTLYNSVFTNPEHALEGLQDFSHMWILFHFHRNDSTHIRAKVAPPRLNGIRTGVFSTRSPHRPCPIGLSLVKIVKIENHTIYFEGVDMVDQTPVLDIKPYIPQYDNPLYIEKINGSESEAPENHDQRSERENGGHLSLNANSRFNPSDVVLDCRENYRMPPLESHDDHSNGLAQVTDISRDEEIALRLQAEEFEGNPNIDGYGDSRNSCQMLDVSLENASGIENNSHSSFLLRAAESPSTYNRTDNFHVDLNAASRRETTSEFSLQSNNPFPRAGNNSRPRNSEHSSGSIGRWFHGVDLNSSGDRDAADAPRSEGSSNYTDEQTSRNSRLLDGADGSSTICGTDADLMYRRAINLRLNNSPVRMGVREAPDGEEGLASQNLTSSQTMSNIQSAITTSNSNLPESAAANSNVVSDGRSTQLSRGEINLPEVRVPDWISTPRISTLSVVFNDRALTQLCEILQDKTEDQKCAIENVLREDPRSVYMRQRWGNQFYTFLIHDLHISCRFDDNRGIVTVFQVRHAGRTCECGVPEWQCLGHSPLS